MATKSKPTKSVMDKIRESLIRKYGPDYATYIQSHQSAPPVKTEIDNSLMKSTDWYYARNEYLQNHSKSVFSDSPIEQVHHLVQYAEYEEPIRTRLLTDQDNLIGLTTEEHQKIHKKPKDLTLDQRIWLFQRMLEICNKYNIVPPQLYYKIVI